jgi:hypothetical protein
VPLRSCFLASSQPSASIPCSSSSIASSVGGRNTVVLYLRYFCELMLKNCWRELLSISHCLSSIVCQTLKFYFIGPILLVHISDSSPCSQYLSFRVTFLRSLADLAAAVRSGGKSQYLSRYGIGEPRFSCLSLRHHEIGRQLLEEAYVKSKTSTHHHPLILNLFSLA